MNRPGAWGTCAWTRWVSFQAAWATTAACSRVCRWSPSRLDHALRMPRDAEVRSMWRDLLRWMEASSCRTALIEQAGKMKKEL